MAAPKKRINALARNIRAKAKAGAPTKSTTGSRGLLLDRLLREGNKRFGDGTFKHISEAPSNTKTYLSTGVPVLDLMASGKLDGGFPCGRIVELFGDESIGKTTIGCALMLSAQQAGGIAIVIDTESTLTQKRILDLGLDANALLYNNERYLESVASQLEFFAVQLHKSPPSVIFWDTVAGTKAKAEDGGGSGGLGVHARVLSKCFRGITKPLAESKTCLVCCNQLKEGSLGQMMVTERSRLATLGGKALRFHASLRVCLTHARQYREMYNKSLVYCGDEIKVKIVKNKDHLSNTTGRFVIRNGRIDPAVSTLLTLVDWDVIKGVKSRNDSAPSWVFEGKRYTAPAWRSEYTHNDLFRADVERLLVKTFSEKYSRDTVEDEEEPYDEDEE